MNAPLRIPADSAAFVVKPETVELYTCEECAAKCKMRSVKHFRARLPELRRRFGFPAPHPAWAGPRGPMKFPGPAVDAWLLTPAWAHLLGAAEPEGEDWGAVLDANAAAGAGR